MPHTVDSRRVRDCRLKNVVINVKENRCLSSSTGGDESSDRIVPRHSEKDDNPGGRDLVHRPGDVLRRYPSRRNPARTQSFDLVINAVIVAGTPGQPRYIKDVEVSGSEPPR